MFLWSGLKDDGDSRSGIYPGDDTTESFDADTDELPPLEGETGAATRTFLAGDGQPLPGLLQVAKSLRDGGECQAAFTSLGSGPPPDQLASIAAETPDVVLGSSFVTLITATDGFITVCLAEGAADVESATQLREIIALIDERLSELP